MSFAHIVNVVPLAREGKLRALAITSIKRSAQRNGDFRQNYGKSIGADLYLRSISAVRGRSFLWSGLVLAALSASVAWLGKLGSLHPH